MSNSQPMTLIFAGPPFDNPAADVVIRSPDGVHFRVRSAIITEASPVFSDMLTSDQTGRTTDGKHLLVIAEESTVLDPLLRLCYPVTDPVFADLKDVRLILAAAMKYQMTEACTLLKKQLRSYMDAQPLRVWASACLLRFEEEAQAAALALFGKEFPIKAPPEFEQVSSGDYFRLTKFLRAGGNVPEGFKFWDSLPEDIPKPEQERQKRHSLFQELGADTPAIAFQSRPYADIVCRSSDGVEFRSHRIILCLASSVLSKKISRLCPDAPPATTTTASTLPILEFKDTPGSVLGPILEACYPTKRRHPTQFDLHQLMSMTACARKYDMQQAQDHLCRGAFWLASRERPLASYLMAARMGFSDYARSTLPNLSGELHTYGCPPEMEDTPATVYHALLINRHQSSIATSRLTGATVTQTSASPSRAAQPGASGPSTGSAPTVAKSKPKAKTPEAPDLRNPWLLNVWRQTAQGLQGCRSNELWKFEPHVPKLLKESLTKKIWCSKCEMNLGLMSGLHDMYQSVRAAKFDHDVSVPLS
ncbi:hypothetical protein GSI_12828 [Ganoderma sinense ZZ0214-1]|uniref:BTB domain-containing protein n=1 Tax=Ganoderma sinense ZZ0214-1 TaxID=1077348 RepID=A0A2G8RTV4_9APHY|nr:hypothetical protein GSI_12828 [Ganoderma sinense ZZ0214-1]